MKPFKIERIAAARGKTPLQLVNDELKETPSIRGVSRSLKVSRDTIKRWVTDQGLTVKRCIQLVPRE